MASRPTAPDRMRRVLAIVPWIVANPGRPVDEIAARFGVTRKELLDDLNVVFMVGVPPYSPDALVDVEIDDEGRVTIRLADFFSRPLRLTPAQGLALLASSDGLLSVPGTDPNGALARALAKLSAALGVGPDEPVDVHLGDVEASLLDELRRAAAESYEVDVDYYSYGRDERTTRLIAPWRVFAEGGSWYVQAWCSLAGGERLFRVDRIDRATVLSKRSDHRPPADDAPGVFDPGPDAPTVTLRLASDAAWVAETYPVEVLERRDGAASVVRMAVTATPWLERLLVRLGPAATVLEASGLDDAVDLASNAAHRILNRYRS